VETGANVPGYSGGAECLSERFFGSGPDAKKRFRSRVLRDVAWGPVVETGANVPGYSGGAECLSERLFGMGPAYPASGKSTSLSSTDPTLSVSGADGASHTSLGIALGTASGRMGVF
jgi:hypothetical protein